VAAGFPADAVHIEPKLDDAVVWAVEQAEANNDLAGGVLVTGSITLVADARILLGKPEAPDGSGTTGKTGK